MSSAVYGRILARLEPPVLQHHCSLVFDDELQAISAELREVLAAYARLQEVREAVATLENGRADVSRSASLMETVDSTAQMQDELMQRMRLVEMALQSRPAVELGREKRTKASEAKAEERLVEHPTEPAKEKKSKRRRHDSSSEDELQPKEEQIQEPAYEQPNFEHPQPPFPVKTIKRIRTTSPESEPASIKAAPDTHKASLLQSAASVSSSETESEGADLHAAEANAERDQTSEVREEDWKRSVRRAIGLADKALQEGAPSSEQVVFAVERLCGVLDVATVPDGETASSLDNGRLTNLIILTIRLLKKNDQDPLVASLISTVLRSIENAIAREPRMRDLRKHKKTLNRIQNKTDPRSSTPATASALPKATATASQPADARVEWLAWRERVAELHRVSSRISHDGRDLLFAEVSAFAASFRETLQMLRPSMATNINPPTRDNFFSMVASAARVFESPGVTKPFIPLLNNVMFAIDDVIKLHGRFNSLHHHSQRLLAIRSEVEKTTEQYDRLDPVVTADQLPEEKVRVSEDVDSKSFEALISIGDELRALQLSERGGRLFIYLFALQKELKLVFPTKGLGLTPSRSTCENMLEAVEKAVELILDEPHTDEHDAVYKQFLELLFSTGARYKLFKQIVARSRDDLYLYLYPDSKPPTKQPRKEAKATKAQTNNINSNSISLERDENSLHEELQTAFNEAHLWDHDVFSLKMFDGVMCVLRRVMKVKTKTWRVRGNRTVSACLMLMVQRARAIKNKRDRSVRLASLAKWQKLMEV